MSTSKRDATIDLQFSEGDIDLDCGRSSSVVKGRRNPEIRGTPGSQPTKLMSTFRIWYLKLIQF